MYRTWVITRHTFFETISQPIYALLLGVAAAALVIFMFLPFFTLTAGDDVVMYKVLGLDIIGLLVLLTTLFATSKAIHEEIEDRTMLTLMSKPVSRLEVLLGKYLGLIGSAGLAVLILGALLCLCTWWRIPTDYLINNRSIDDRELTYLSNLRASHLNGLYPSLLLLWLQISVLAALSVAISTRFSLVVNLPTVILLYLAGNLARFIDSAVAGQSSVTVALGKVLETLLPFLEVFDLRTYAVYGRIGATEAETPNQVISLSFIWQNTALAGLYAVCYVAFALALGLLVFRNRELGGNEG
jgi:ABC-type transport system involved in multi-copper enzyme maturation permease subunit